MINSVVIVGVLKNKPQKIKSDIKNLSVTEGGFSFYEFIIKIKSPNLKYWKEEKYNEIIVKTFDFNLKRYLSVLNKNIIIAIKGRVCEVEKKTTIFADQIFIIGKEK